MIETKQADATIGKFDLLATHVFATALSHGLPEGEAKEKGMIAAIMGAKSKLARSAGRERAESSQKELAEKKKKTTITAESFDRQIADKMGPFFEKTFLPTMRKLVAAGYSYDEVKRLVKIPSTWGAKISGSAFVERTAEAFKSKPKNKRRVS